MTAPRALQASDRQFLRGLPWVVHTEALENGDGAIERAFNRARRLKNAGFIRITIDPEVRVATMELTDAGAIALGGGK